MAVTNDPETQHRNRERVIPGDITLRLQDTYIPDFYRDLTVGGQLFVKPSDPDNPDGPTELDLLQNALVRFVELCGPNLDYLLERAKDLPQLVQIDNAPWEFLYLLGSMLGYHWVDTKDAEQQRKDIELFLEQCRIKGTRRGIERAVLKSGATRARVTNLSDSIFTISGLPQLARFKRLGLHWYPWDDDTGLTADSGLVLGVLGSQISGSDRLTDPYLVRWGVYEIATDLALPRYIDALVCYAHPAGTRFVTALDSHRRIIASPEDEGLNIDFEVQTQQDVLIDVVERLAVSDDADPEVLLITAAIIERSGIEVTGTADTEPTLPSILFEDTKQVII